MDSQNPNLFHIPLAIQTTLRELEQFHNVQERLQYLENYLTKCKKELSMFGTWKLTLPQSMLILVNALEVIKDNIIVHGNDVEKLIVSEFIVEWKRRINDIEGQMKMADSSSSSSLTDQTYKGKMKDLGINRPEATLDCFLNKSDDHNDIWRMIKSDSCDSVEKNSKTGKDLEPWNRATRRSWTPELHEKFLIAMNKVGGPQSASPKRIKEAMKVEGLTTDQIKSHLQKYRIHKRVTPDRNNGVKIDGSDGSNQPNHDHQPRNPIPNLNIGLFDDQGYEPQVIIPVEQNQLGSGGDVSAARVVENNLGGDEASTSGVERDLGDGDDVGYPWAAVLMGWLSGQYFKATDDES